MKYIITIFMFFIITNAYTQKGKIIYVASVKEAFDNTNLNNKTNDYIELFTDVQQNNSDLKFMLFFNKNESYFQIIDEMSIESNQNFTKILAGKGNHYYDNQLKYNVLIKEFLGEKFLIQKNNIKWTLTNETQKIGNYSCKKAISTIEVEGRSGVKLRNITAWYTTDIPINFGPKNYNGLPGLILKLKEGNLYFTARNITLNPEEGIKIKKPKTGNNITEVDFNKIVKKYASNRRE